MPPHHPIRRWITTALAATLLAMPHQVSAQSVATASLDDPVISQLYPIAQKVRVMSELCAAQFPQHAASIVSAYADWSAKHARAQLDSLIEQRARRRAAIGRSVIRTLGAGLFGGDPASACASFATLLATPEHDLGVANLTTLQSARRKLGVPAWTPPDAPIAPVAVASAPPSPPSPPSPPAASPESTAAVLTPAERMRQRMSGTPRASEAPAAGPAAPMAASAGTGPVRSLGDVAPPSGWSKAAQADGSITFTIARNDTGFATIAIATDQPLVGRSLDNALRHWLRAQLASRLELSLQHTVDVARTVYGQPAAYADETPDFHDSRDGMRMVAIAVQRGAMAFTPVLMLTKDDQYQYNRVKEFGRWFGSVTLPGDAGTPWSPRTSARAAPLQGLWLGTQMRIMPNLYGGTELIAHRNYLTLFRDGLVYRDLPEGGQIDKPDLTRLCSDDPTDCGTYRVEPSRLLLDFPTRLGLVETDTAEIRMPITNPVALEFDGATLSRVAPVTSERLDGEFTSIEGTSSGPNGSLMLSRSIRFFADGRYESTRAVGFASTPGASTGSESGSVVGYSNSGPNRGTYTISGYTLTMKPEGGPPRYASIIFFDAERPVRSVLIDDEYYRR